MSKTLSALAVPTVSPIVAEDGEAATPSLEERSFGLASEEGTVWFNRRS